MKKELLFIINNLHCGGAEKSLISLLQMIDYSQYNVDLYLFKKEGVFLKQLPKEVVLLEAPKNYSYFDGSMKNAIVQNLKSGNLKVIYNRILAGFVNRVEKKLAVREQRVWKYLRNVIAPLDKRYDVAIGYLENTPNYFCVDKVHARTKIGFIHTDYSRAKMNAKIDFPYFEKLDKVVAVSASCKEDLEHTFPKLKNKFKLLHNIVSSYTILKLSLEFPPFKKEKFTLLSVGRLHFVKGYDIAIKACKILIDKNIDIQWYVIGEGGERDKLEELIKENQLEDYFILLGLKENPYPYIKNSDIFVHTARFEGFGIVLTEAKILHKPMVVTNFTTVKDQITHNSNGLIAEINPMSIAENLERLILDENLRNQFSKNLAKENVEMGDEMDNFYNLIEN